MSGSFLAISGSVSACTALPNSPGAAHTPRSCSQSIFGHLRPTECRSHHVRRGCVATLRRHVTLGVAAPDCWERQVLLVNGQLGPTLEVVQGEELQVRGRNRFKAFPSFQLASKIQVSRERTVSLVLHACHTATSAWPRADRSSSAQCSSACCICLIPLRQLTLHNDLPSDWPNVHPGLSIHWHGFDMKGYPCEQGF